MRLLDPECIEDLLHSSSTSKGIEKTMERLLNEIETDNIYIIKYDKDLEETEISYEWTAGRAKLPAKLDKYIDFVEDYYHFEDDNFFFAEKTKELSPEESRMYRSIGFETVAEYKMTNHGKVFGFIVIGWEDEADIDYETIVELHTLLKLINEVLIRHYKKTIVGDNDWKIYRLAGEMTKTILLILNDDLKITYINTYCKDKFPDIKIGDYYYSAVEGLKETPEDAPFFSVKPGEEYVNDRYFPYLDKSFEVVISRVNTKENTEGFVVTMREQDVHMMSNTRSNIGKKFVFALGSIYKDLIAVELRRDTFYNLLDTKLNNKNSYSMNFVLKWLSKLHLDDKQKFIECFDINFLQNDFAAGVRKKEIDFRYRTHQGDYHTMNARAIFEENNNKEVMVYILFQDVEQVRSERIEEETKMRESMMAAISAAELKGAILSSISHEIRTPVGGIVSMTGVAKQVVGDKKRLLECLNDIDNYADTMIRVMDSLLETVGVENDTININKHPFRVDHLLNRIDIQVREEADKRNLFYKLENKCRYPLLVGDSIRIIQAINYIFRNLMNYTPVSGTLGLKVSQMAIDGTKIFVRFTVESTGVGMTDRMKESLFGFSLDTDKATLDDEHLELSLASQLIRLMGGNVGLDVNGTGTHIYFTLPLEIADPEKQNVTKKRVNSLKVDFTGKKILLAEDSEMSMDATKAVLEVVGFEVDTAENGRKAVVEYVSHPAGTYDAIIMDVHMPLMDGREATRTIRISGKEDSETIPIIGLMANSQDEDVVESKNAGMQNHLSKPVDVDTLYRVLRKLIPEE